MDNIDEAKKLIADAVQTAFNDKLIKFFQWVVLLLVGQYVVYGTAIWWAAHENASMQNRLDYSNSDRYDGTMAVVTEWERTRINPGYNIVDIRKIQKDQINQP